MKSSKAQLTLITGGAGSGKSAFAEQLCLQVGQRRTYVATMEAFGEEGRKRVERHRQLRAGKGFVTVERPRSIGALQLASTNVVLLECLGTLVANELFDDEAEGCVGTHEKETAALATEIFRGIEKLRLSCQHMLVVSNDVACDGACYTAETMRYIEVLSQLNCLVAAQADCMVEVVCGLPLWLKGGAAQ